VRLLVNTSFRPPVLERGAARGAPHGGWLPAAAPATCSAAARISGPGEGEAGAIIELARGGQTPVALGDSGEQRSFIEDGDAVLLRGWCEKPGHARIGFGESRGTVLPARG
jgi:fumarylacetoacetase